MFIVGTYELTIDGKNRLSIPLAVRDRMDSHTDGKGFCVMPGRVAGTLAIYQDRYFERLSQKLQLPEDASDETYNWWVFARAMCVPCEPDAQGRIVLPRLLMDRAGIPRGEVTVVGVQDHLEVWTRAAFNRFLDEMWPTYPDARAKAMKELRDSGAAEPEAAVPSRTE